MTQTYLKFFFYDHVGVWNFETGDPPAGRGVQVKRGQFRSLGFVCYLGFVICNFHELQPLYIKNADELNLQSAIPSHASRLLESFPKDSQIFVEFPQPFCDLLPNLNTRSLMPTSHL